MKLLLKNSNLCDHNPPKSQTQCNSSYGFPVTVRITVRNFCIFQLQSLLLLGLAYLLIVTEYQLRAGRPVAAQAAQRARLSLFCLGLHRVKTL